MQEPAPGVAEDAAHTPESTATTAHAAVTYSSYLRVADLLSLQAPRSTQIGADGRPSLPLQPEHDEMLFIVIHQVYELWFKQILHELDYLQAKLRAGDTPRALHTMRRMLTILKTVVAQVDVLETMTPLEFNSFRGFLESASGFQSSQFREVEFALGHKRPTMLAHFAQDPAAAARLQARFDAPTLWDAFLAHLHTQGYPVPPADLRRDVTRPIEPSLPLQDLLLHIYRTDPHTMALCERLVDWDEGFQEWRYRHVKMVERTIGNKRGTGGSAGVNYLQRTLAPLYPDLWAIRTRL
ncbi:MAG: tryptophan 2,3-dioxygenase [Caldilineaceae bacterium]